MGSYLDFPFGRLFVYLYVCGASSLLRGCLFCLKVCLCFFFFPVYICFQLESEVVIMHKWRKLVVGAVLGTAALCLSAVTNIAAAAAPQNAAVVYYTLLHNREQGNDKAVGKTQRLAQEIAKQTNSTLLEVKNTKKYPAKYGDTVDIAREELNNGDKLPLAAPVDVSAYKDIYIGMPCWWGSYPRVFATWFEGQDFSDKNIYVFVTHGGSRYGRIIQDMQKALPQANIKPLLEMHDSDVTDYSDSELAKEVKEALDEL